MSTKLAVKSKTFSVTCPTKWAKLTYDRRDMYQGGRVDHTAYNGEYSIIGVMTPQQRDEFVANGGSAIQMGNQMFKPNEDGLLEYKFKRTHQNKKRSDIIYGPPSVFNVKAAMEEAAKNGSTDLKEYRVKWEEEIDGEIGNGSVCTIVYELWGDSETNRNCRLVSVGVQEVVTFVRDNDEDEDDIPF